MEAATTISERIRQSREANQYTRKELAKKSYISPPLLSRYENDGERIPNVLHIRRLAGVLNVDKCWLAFGEAHNGF